MLYPIASVHLPPLYKVDLFQDTAFVFVDDRGLLYNPYFCPILLSHRER